MAQVLETERLALKDRAERTRKAQSLLRDYKATLAATLRDSRGLIVALDAIGRIKPTVDDVFTGSARLRDFIHGLNKPLPFTGLVHGKPVTTLSIAAAIDPRIEAAGNLLVLTSTAIEVAHAEVDEITIRITPLHSATTAFLATHSRADMLVLIAAVPSAASYFEAH